MASGAKFHGQISTAALRPTPPLWPAGRSMLEKPSSWLFVRCADRISPPHTQGGRLVAPPAALIPPLLRW